MGDTLFKEIFFIAIGLIFLSVLLRTLFTLIANNYIENNKIEIYKQVTLANEGRKTGLYISNNFNMFRDYIHEMGLNNNHRCSSSVVSNARNDVVKYILKYSNLNTDPFFVEQLDFCIKYLDNLYYFEYLKDELTKQIKRTLPLFIRLNATKDKLIYTVCEIDEDIVIIKRPHFTFHYVSPAGKTSNRLSIEITAELLMSLQSEISGKITKKEHSKAQRSAMTRDLREAIKQRDNYTCCICGNSVYKEPNLLLEVDHIIPVAKGGKTEASNLQTLCWKCNRIKSAN